VSWSETKVETLKSESKRLTQSGDSSDHPSYDDLSYATKAEVWDDPEKADACEQDDELGADDDRCCCDDGDRSSQVSSIRCGCREMGDEVA
jgi:hypothetical protein